MMEEKLIYLSSEENTAICYGEVSFDSAWEVCVVGTLDRTLTESSLYLPLEWYSPLWLIEMAV